MVKRGQSYVQNVENFVWYPEDEALTCDVHGTMSRPYLVELSIPTGDYGDPGGELYLSVQREVPVVGRRLAVSGVSRLVASQPLVMDLGDLCKHTYAAAVKLRALLNIPDHPLTKSIRESYVPKEPAKPHWS